MGSPTELRADQAVEYLRELAAREGDPMLDDAADLITELMGALAEADAKVAQYEAPQDPPPGFSVTPRMVRPTPEHMAAVAAACRPRR